uniref:TSA: Wollemia nobilis Ref_Wollemi_Transcript_13455_1450 transcribed RNA sequence n=1 Tax=Wollemia nobilis TaxID=56998 RepID=A0A0C9S520_9CONI
MEYQSMSVSQAFQLIALLSLITLHLVHGKVNNTHGCYRAIYSFGDSLTDTGNLLSLISSPALFAPIKYLPYGETYFQKPTGRSSDGRLLVDFLAEACELPYLPPSLDKDANFNSGVNFAVAGATANNASFFVQRDITINIPPWSLDTQIQAFKYFKKFYCDRTPDCKDHFENALFLVGEIGGNDYNYLFLEGSSMEEIKIFVPFVVQRIRAAIETLIQENAKKFIVPGNLPIGCSPSYLSLYQSNSSSDFDSIGCLINFNNFSQYGNNLLQTMLKDVQKQYPNVSIVYADYYSAAMEIFKNPWKYGFQCDILRVCCGKGGKYNYSPPLSCDLNAALCTNPNQYFHWDGIHPTEAAYRTIANMFLHGTFTTPPLHLVDKDVYKF